MGKKILVLSLCFVLIFSLGASSLDLGNYIQEEESVIRPGNFIYLKSHEVGPAIYDYAETNFETFSLALPDALEGVDIKNINTKSKLALGTPFAVGDVSYFPMIIEEKVIALVSIFEDKNNNLTWSLSVDFSNALNELNTQTTEKNPATLSIINNNIIATTNSKTIKLTNNPEMDINKITTETDLLTVNILEKILESESDVVLKQTEFSTLSTRVMYLSLDRSETQGAEPWCAAYASAQILRATGWGNIYAITIMRATYPNDTDAVLRTRSLSHSQLMNYAHSRGSRPMRISSRLTFSAAKNEIDNHRPIYLSTYGTGIYDGGRHAFVLRGYNVDIGIYSVWNPWNTTYSVMPISTNTISVTGGTFVWDVTIYNWTLSIELNNVPDDM